MSDLAAGKKAAAIKAVDDYVKVGEYILLIVNHWLICHTQTNQKLGVGSGSTIVFAVERLGKSMLTAEDTEDIMMFFCTHS